MTSKKIFLLIALAIVLISGCGKIVVTGRMNGERNNSTVEVTDLTVTRGNAEAVNTKRLYSFDGEPSGTSIRLPSTQLKIEITGNPNDLQESYNYIQFVSDVGTFDGGVSHSKSFIENNFGKIFFLSSPQEDASEESVTNNTSHVGAAELFIIQNDDRTVPWKIDSGNSRCFNIGGGDCFDMETYTRSLFASIVNGVEPSVDSLFTNPTITKQELRYIPHVIHSGFENDGRRARGFGLVYFAEINIITGKAFVYIPLKFLFLDNVNGYTFFMDPIDNSALIPGESVSRSIYVKGEFITSAIEGIIRDNIDSSISKMAPDEIIPGIDNGEVLMLSFNTATGLTTQQAVNFRTKPIYDFVLIPESGANGYPLSTVLWEKIGDGEISNVEKVKLVFLE